VGAHRRSNIYVPADAETDTPRGRHRAKEDTKDSGLKTATVVVATGAIVAGATSLGTGTATAAPLPAPEAPAASTPFGIPEHLIPAGFEMPHFEVPDGLVLPENLDLPPWPTLPELPDFGLPQVGEQDMQPIGLRAVQPVSGTLTSSFGQRWGTHHSGTDIAAPIGTPVLAAADGVVTAAGPATGFGLWVKVRHVDGTETVYGHVDTFSVTEGETVSAGQRIATVGNRGHSTGPHLHFEVHDPSGVKVDPAAWLATRGVAVTWNDSARNA
jgi:murein DD-endopeptidase MepM/ murein hydrolase activator NlpD